jgi:hypothetical protein
MYIVFLPKIFLLISKYIFYISDLKVGEEKLKKCSDSPWKICRGKSVGIYSSHCKTCPSFIESY